MGAQQWLRAFDPQVARSRRRELPFPASFTLHEGDFGGGDVVLIVLHRSFSVDTRLRFEVAESPKTGMVRVLAQYSSGTELLHLAANHETAASWLKQHPHSNAVLEEVLAEERTLQAA